MDNFTQQIYSLLVVMAAVLVTTVIGPVPFLSCQGFQRGGGLIVRRVARTYVARTVPDFVQARSSDVEFKAQVLDSVARALARPLSDLGLTVWIA